ncbi:uncharacterized protein LOC114537899 isoform X2 [Dendronephthya gigantea]|uniref:uncharacterized protein LOC114537899 isoform X2 n=1 Tax=Dendronephthya gigantea TaxID=151771 RepID=UPI00106C3E4E|nr:uncharacterized protein LOC114537899 isoform X2 [Dendronephthya gigantea]
MLPQGERTCFSTFVYGLPVLLAILPAATSNGLSAAKIENVTIHKQARVGLIYYNVPIEWQFTPFNQSRVPSFQIWLTSDDKDFGNKRTIDSSTPGGNMFKYIFLRLPPDKNYTAHIECYSSTKNLISYANITFGVKREILTEEGVMSTNICAADGYLFIHWAVPEDLRYSSTPVSFDMTVCNTNSTPQACTNGVKTMCKAIYYYNGSSCSGSIQLYEENWKKYVTGEHSDVDTSMARPLLKSWDKLRYVFGCGIYLETCKKVRFVQPLKYYVRTGDGIVGNQYEKVELYKGFSSPELGDDFVHLIQTRENPNSITAVIRLRFNIICTRNSARNFRFILSTSGEDIYKHRVVDIVDVGHSYNGTYTKWIHVPHIIPHSNYTVRVITTTFVDIKPETTTRTFTTPEGVPNHSPELQPTFLGVYDCTENKRNVTVNWKFPDPRERNGVIRNVTVKYFTKNSNPKYINLPRVTTTTIFGLDCDTEYSVQVRACYHGNTNCSVYSKIRVITVHHVDIDRQTGDVNYRLPLWISLGIGVLLILVLFIVSLYCVCRKKKKALEPDTKTTPYCP